MTPWGHSQALRCTAHLENVLVLLKWNFPPFASPFRGPPAPQPLAATFPCPAPVTLTPWRPQVVVVPLRWLISLGGTPPGCLPVALLSDVGYRATVCVYRVLVSRSPPDGHLGAAHILAIANAPGSMGCRELWAQVTPTALPAVQGDVSLGPLRTVGSLRSWSS